MDECIPAYSLNMNPSIHPCTPHPALIKVVEAIISMFEGDEWCYFCCGSMFPNLDLNPLMLTAAKTSLTILMMSFRLKHKIFQGEMLFRTLPTTLLQIFCKIILNSKVIVKRIFDPDDTFWRNSLVLMG